MKNLSKKLGIQTEGPLTIALCLQKARKLGAGIKKDRWSGELRKAAVIYRTRYLRKALALRKAKRKGPKKATKKAA